MEKSQFRAGEGRRGSNASQSATGASTPAHQVRGGQSGKEESGEAGEWDEEQEKSANCEYGPGAESRNQGFPAASVFDSIQLPKDGAGEDDGGEFDSPRGGEETRGRQSTAKGDKSTAKTRFRSPRGENVKEGEALWQYSKTILKSAREWTRALLKETDRERTTALLREAAKVRASFHLKKSSGALSIEEESRWFGSRQLVHSRKLEKRGNVGGRVGGNKERITKEH